MIANQKKETGKRTLSLLQQKVATKKHHFILRN